MGYRTAAQGLRGVIPKGSVCDQVNGLAETL